MKSRSTSARERAHLRDAPQGEDQPRLSEDRRDPSERDIPGRHPHHDRQGDIHRQWRRTRRRLPDPPLSGRHLLPREGRLFVPHHPLPGLLAGVRDRPEKGADLRQDRPQETHPGTMFLRALGFDTREDIVEAFYHIREGRDRRRAIREGKGDQRVLAKAIKARSTARRRSSTAPATSCISHDIDELVHLGSARDRGHRLRAPGLAALRHDPQLLRARGHQVRQGRYPTRTSPPRTTPWPRSTRSCAGRAHHGRNAEKDLAIDVLLRAALRPGQGGPLQAQQEIRLYGTGEGFHSRSSETSSTR